MQNIQEHLEHELPDEQARLRPLKASELRPDLLSLNVKDNELEALIKSLFYKLNLINPQHLLPLAKIGSHKNIAFVCLW